MDGLIEWFGAAVSGICLVVFISCIVAVVVSAMHSLGKSVGRLFDGSARRRRDVARRESETVLRAIALKRLLDQEAFRAHQQLIDQARRSSSNRGSGSSSNGGATS